MDRFGGIGPWWDVSEGRISCGSSSFLSIWHC
jgi:hypothetical protein